MIFALIGKLCVGCCVALLCVLLTDCWRERRVQTSGPRRGIAPRSREPVIKYLPEPPYAPRAAALPVGNWCGCCGRPAPGEDYWCWRCLAHVDADASSPVDATWYAQHGTLCPFTDLEDEYVAEQSRDIAPEGLGWPLDQVRDGYLISLGELKAVDQDVFGPTRRTSP